MRGARTSVLLSLILLVACGNGSGGGGFFSASTVAPSTSAQTSVATPSGPVRTAPANLATGPSLILDTSPAAGFHDSPFPSNARVLPSGGPDLTNFPNPLNKDFVRRIVALAESDVRGFSPTGPITFRFDGAVNAPVDDPVATTRPGAPIFVVDIDPASRERLSRHPIRVAVTGRADSCRPANLVQLLPVPGRGLRPNTTYAAIVLRKLGAPTGPFLGQSPAFTALLAGTATGPWENAIAPLIPALRDLQIHPDDVAAATVFTTCDPAAETIAQIAHVDALPPPALVGPIAVRDQYPEFTALRGYYAPPMYQEGAPPYAFSGGRLVLDAQRMPVAQWTDKAEFQISIPKGKMPAAGFPLILYIHGTGGDPSHPIDRGRWTTPTTPPPAGSGPASYVAPRGWSMACASGHMSPGRIGKLSADGYMAYNFLNAVAMRDNFRQMLFEQVHFKNLLLSLRIDPALCPGTDASASKDGKVRFDPDHLVVQGQSLGSYLSGMLAATLPSFKGAVLSGAGGSWIEFPFGPVDPITLKTWVEFLTLPGGEQLDRFHPLLLGFDLACGPADNTHYLPHVLREPLPGHVPPHVLVIEGHKDLQVPTNLQRALVLALGVDMAGPDVGATTDEQLAPILPIGNLRQLPFPASLDVTTPQGPRTGIAVRYKEDGIREGHYVIFQLDAPKRQVVDFLDGIATGTAPVVR